MLEIPKFEAQTHFLFTESTSNNTAELYIHSPIAEGKFPIYLVSHQSQFYALKVFPQDNRLYKNESRFTSLQHPNITSPLYCLPSLSHSSLSPKRKFSCILTRNCPNGSFFSLLKEKRMKLSEKVVRTYMAQLIDALDYLHAQGIAHFDLKLENLLLDEKYRLQLIDFDLSLASSEDLITSRGTDGYRAPELGIGHVNPQQADVYALGIIMFTLLKGRNPYKENSRLQKLLYENPQAFWSKYVKRGKEDEEIDSEEFQDLFFKMTKERSYERITLGEVKNSSWMAGETLSEDELFDLMSQNFEKKNEE